MTDLVLEISKLSVAYGRIRALDDVDLHVGRGECVALLGANGAGKSTLLRTVSGLLRPLSGRICFEGAAIEGLPPHRIVARGICQVPEGRRIFPELTVRENLVAGAHLHGRPDQEELAWAFALFPVLRARLDQPGGTLSGGEQQMLALARALMGRPRLLMLDEPSLGLAPMVVEQLYAAIEQIKARTTLLLVEQKVHLALALVDRAYVLRHGRIVREGRREELLAGDWISGAYLGGESDGG